MVIRISVAWTTERRSSAASASRVGTPRRATTGRCTSTARTGPGSRRCAPARAERRAGALEQQLAREQRAVELEAGDRAHRPVAGSAMGERHAVDRLGADVTEARASRPRARSRPQLAARGRVGEHAARGRGTCAAPSPARRQGGSPRARACRPRRTRGSELRSSSSSAPSTGPNRPSAASGGVASTTRAPGTQRAASAIAACTRAVSPASQIASACSWEIEHHHTPPACSASPGADLAAGELADQHVEVARSGRAARTCPGRSGRRARPSSRTPRSRRASSRSARPPASRGGPPSPRRRAAAAARAGCGRAVRSPPPSPQRTPMPLGVGVGEQRREVDEDAVVVDQLAGAAVDRHHRDGDLAAVLARVGDIGLHDRRVALLERLHELVAHAADGPAEARPRVADRVAAVHRIGVAEAHRRVVGQVRREAVGLHRVDVGEQGGAVGHGSSLGRTPP